MVELNGDDSVLLAVLGVAALATLAALYVIAQSLALLRRPHALVETGQWEEARRAALDLGQSWLRLFPSVREDSAYARAACLHLEGKLDDSLGVLREMPERARLAPAARLLEGANLVIGERDPARAVECLTFACASPRSSAEDLLFLALAKVAVGDADGAEDAFHRAGTKRPKNAPSPSIYEPAFHYLRALYLVKTDREKEASSDLDAAAAGSVTTIYVERARERARAHAAPASSPGDEADSPASLSPQVIDE
jgi:hypothetical protein